MRFLFALVLLLTLHGHCLAARALELLGKTEAGPRPVRLLGVSVHNLTDSASPPMARTRRGVDLPRLPFDDDSAAGD